MLNEIVIAELSKLVEGLTYMSETDAPLKTFLWESTQNELDITAVREILKLSPKTSITLEAFEDFFNPATEIQDWFDEETTAQAIRFQALVHSMKNMLTDLQVFRINEKNIDVYAVGKTQQGNWAGVKTFVVET